MVELFPARLNWTELGKSDRGTESVMTNVGGIERHVIAHHVARSYFSTPLPWREDIRQIFSTFEILY